MTRWIRCFAKGAVYNQRRRLWEQQKGACYYCKRMMVIEIKEPNSCTVDHVIPKCRGGGQNNVVGACWRCNALKGAFTVDEFLAMYPNGEFPEAYPYKNRRAQRAARKERRRKVKEFLAEAKVTERVKEKAGYDPKKMGYANGGFSLSEVWPND